MKKTKIYMGVPTVGTVVDSQAYLLRKIQENYKDSVELVYPKECVRRLFHDFARNAIVEDFLTSDCDLLWFLDSDITPAENILDLLKKQDIWQAAGATYPVFMTPTGSDSPQVVFTVYKVNPATGNLALAHTPTTGEEFVDGLATGCLFVKREVFSKLSKPYFEFKFKTDSKEMSEGEDLGFCRKLSEFGIQFFTDYSLICKHQKTVDLLDVNNYAIEYSNRSVISYDSMIKTQILQAVKDSYDLGYKQALEDIHQKVKTKGLKLEKASSIWTQIKV